MSDNTTEWRVYRVLLLGENGWFEDGLVTLKPGESPSDMRERIARVEGRPCRLVHRLPE